MELYHDCSLRLNEGYIKLANEHNINAIDAGKWNIEMGCAGVHFSIDGHKKFAESLLEFLSGIL